MDSGEMDDDTTQAIEAAVAALSRGDCAIVVGGCAATAKARDRAGSGSAAADSMLGRERSPSGGERELSSLSQTASRSELVECSLVMAAEHATGERVAFMVRHSAGIISAASDQERFNGFGLSSGSHGYVSTDYLPDVSTGVSAKDRAATLRALCNTSNSARDFGRPGNTFPVCAFSGGVLERPGLAEASVDLCRLSKLQRVGVFAELMHEDGTMYRPEDAAKFAEQRALPLITVQQLCNYRRARENVDPVLGCPELESESKMWVDDIKDECVLRVYRTSDPKVEIVTIVKGTVRGEAGVPARVHSECLTGDVLGSKRCDCGLQLHKFLRVLDGERCGVLLYIRGHEGRGIGLANKIRAYKLQDQGLDTIEANLKLGLPVDSRSYDDCLGVLRHLGIASIRLFTNNPEKVTALREITQEVAALSSIANEQSMAYLTTKAEKMNHRTVLETFKLPKPKADISKICVGLVYTSWNQYYVNELLRVAEEELDHAGVRHVRMSVPGASDLISGSRAMLRLQQPSAVLVLGVLIRGSSDVYDVTCNSVMTGLSELNASQDTPIVSGLLMCKDEEQAHERSHGSNNPAKAYADATLHMASLFVDQDAEFCRQQSGASYVDAGELFLRQGSPGPTANGGGS